MVRSSISQLFISLMPTQSRSKSNFPNYDDGDVHIMLSLDHNDHFVLPSVVLSTYSGFFRASLSKHWSAGVTAGVESKSQIKWHYQLLFDNDGDNNELEGDEGVTMLSKSVRSSRIESYCR